MIQKKSGEITLELSDEQYAKLKQPVPSNAIPKNAGIDQLLGPSSSPCFFN
jgi:hypothetical protein